MRHCFSNLEYFVENVHAILSKNVFYILRENAMMTMQRLQYSPTTTVLQSMAMTSQNIGRYVQRKCAIAMCIFI